MSFIVATKSNSNKNVQEPYGDDQEILLNNVKEMETDLMFMDEEPAW